MNKLLGHKRLLSLAQILLLTLFILWQNLFLSSVVITKDLPAALDGQSLRLFSLGEPALLARLLGYWLQSYDSQSGEVVSYAELDYDKLIAWLDVMLQLDPFSQEPLLAASRIFIEVKDPERLRKLIDFVRKHYLIDPDRRWRWMVDATLIAKHRLHDQSLALVMAGELRQHSAGASVPYWVFDMEHLILAELGEWESASLIIKSMLESGVIEDARELQFLTQQLREIKENLNKTR